MSKFQDVLDSQDLVLVDFFAEWCGPCKTMKPILSQLKKSIGDNVKIIKVDVDKNNALASRLKIQGVPTLALYKKGKMVWRQSGVIPENELEQLINKHQ